MNELPITKLYEKQISLTEWFHLINHPDTEALRKEDNEKRERLARLNTIIGLPKERQADFTAQEVTNRTPRFIKFLNEQGEEQCAMRLIPQKEGLPKLRMRGHTVNTVVNGWFVEQAIDPAHYLVEFVAHPKQHHWSTIFIINQQGIFGEIIAESHQYLTQGFYTTTKPIVFSSNFTTWTLQPANPDAQHHLENIMALLKVADAQKRKLLSKELNATFAQDYLCGYFETVDSEFGTWFIDYNRLLGKQYQEFTISTNPSIADLNGQTGCAGKTTGRVRIVANPEGATITPEEVLVCDMTTPDHVPLMQHARAIITNRGGILCHAAIIARELHIPCIIGTGNATEKLTNDDLVEVDATKGTVKIVEQKI